MQKSIRKVSCFFQDMYCQATTFKQEQDAFRKEADKAVEVESELRNHITVLEERKSTWEEEQKAQLDATRRQAKGFEKEQDAMQKESDELLEEAATAEALATALEADGAKGASAMPTEASQQRFSLPVPSYTKPLAIAEAAVWAAGAARPDGDVAEVAGSMRNEQDSDTSTVADEADLVDPDRASSEEPPVDPQPAADVAAVANCTAALEADGAKGAGTMQEDSYSVAATKADKAVALALEAAATANFLAALSAKRRRRRRFLHDLSAAVVRPTGDRDVRLSE